jgi:hypothetical protein
MSAAIGITHTITYRRAIDNATLKLEWTCPKGWGASAVRDAFEAQYPGAEIISITEDPCSI